MKAQLSVEFLLLFALTLSLLIISLGAARGVVEKGDFLSARARACDAAMAVAEHAKYLCMLAPGSSLSLEVDAHVRGNGKRVVADINGVECAKTTWCLISGEGEGDIRLQRTAAGVSID